MTAGRATRRRLSGAAHDSSIDLSECVCPSGIVHEQALTDGRVDPALLEQVAVATQQIAKTGRTAVCGVVALPRGVHPEHQLSGAAVRDGCLDQVERAVRAVAPPERLVVDDERAGRQQVAVVATVLDLVDVTE